MLQRIPGHTAATTASVQGMVHDEAGRAVPGVTITAIRAGVAIRTVTSNSEGIFRMLDLPLGTYRFQAGKNGFSPEALSGIQLTGGELLTLEVRLQSSRPATPVIQAGDGTARHQWDRDAGTAADLVLSHDPTDLEAAGAVAARRCSR